MTMKVRAALFLFLFTALTTANCRAQAPANPPPDRVIITFVLPITPDTVNALIQVVNVQVKIGFKKITIVLASPGGDPMSAFAAYNILKSVPAEITTFNAGNTDSAAMLIYCAGKYRYSLPAPARFLIHSAALNPITTNYPVDRTFLESQLAQLNNINQITVQVMKENSTKSQAEIETAVKGQTILSPEQAKEWGLVQEIRSTYTEPNSTFASVNPPEGSPDANRGHFTTQNPITSLSQPVTNKDSSTNNR